LETSIKATVWHGGGGTGGAGGYGKRGERSNLRETRSRKYLIGSSKKERYFSLHRGGMKKGKKGEGGCTRVTGKEIVFDERGTGCRTGVLGQ